jgi:hypothetical protein
MHFLFLLMLIKTPSIEISQIQLPSRNCWYNHSSTYFNIWTLGKKRWRFWTEWLPEFVERILLLKSMNVILVYYSLEFGLILKSVIFLSCYWGLRFE